jgi:alcohol dehydrogenase
MVGQREDGLDAPAGEFSFTRLEKVVFGPGKLAVLGGELDRRGLNRAVIVTGQSLARSGLAQRVAEALGGRCAGVFDRARQHVPRSTVLELWRLIDRLEADTVVSFGGGSPIDTSKVAIACALTGRDMTLEARELALDSSAQRQAAGSGRDIFHIAIPTTLSAGEYTSGGGVMDEATRIKRGVFDPRLQARLIINDPELTLATPDWLWASTGMRALDHAVEAIYSVRHQPFVDALATKAIKLIVRHLPQSVTAAGAERIVHRGQCQIGAWLSLFGGLNTGLGISHALGHQIGPKWDVPHGITSCITLPHAMRFVAGISPERFAAIADGLGVPFDDAAPTAGALACAQRVADFVARLPVPRTLKEAGVSHNELSMICEAVRHEIARFEIAARPITADDVMGLIEAAYAGSYSATK